MNNKFTTIAALCTTLTVGTVCTGIGSPEQALQNLGVKHKIVFGCEIDKYARETYLANFNPGFMEPDMTKCDWIDQKYYADLFIGGIPCQAFSLAGKRLGELDPRGLLFFDFYRYVKNQQPKYFIIENVKGLLSDNGGATFRNWINLLGQSENGNTFMFPHEDSLMYNLHWQVLNTKDYGLPQNRERVFLIGIRNDLPNTFVFPKGVPLKLRLKDILEPEVDEKYYLSDKIIKGFQNHSENMKLKGNGFSFKPIENTESEISSVLTARYYKMGIDDNYLKVQSATKSGYEIATEGDSINLEHPNSETRRGRVGKQVAQTLTTSCNQGVMIGAMRGRYDESGKTNQELEIKDDNITNTLTSVQKDNLVVETFDYPRVKHQLTGDKWDRTHEANGRVYDENGIAPTIQTMQGGNQEPKTFDNYRIRKLTPREVFRLQGFPDEFLQNAVDAGVSNSQLYKQAGNSISVPVIQAILKNLLPGSFTI